jgi:hypothetical protein
VPSAGGRERFLLVASPRPLLVLEDHVRSLARAEHGREVVAAPLSEPTMTRLRGTGGIFEPPAEPGPDAASSDAAASNAAASNATAPNATAPNATASDAAPSSGTRLGARARPLGPGREEIRGVWVRAIDFEKP